MDAEARRRCASRASRVGLAANIALFVLKLLTGMAIHAMSVVVDAFNNLSDGLSAALGLLSARLSGKPADRDHPYGHGRVEYIATFVVSVLVFSVGLELLGTSVRKLFAPSELSMSPVSAALLCASALVKLGLFVFYRDAARRADLPLLKVSSRDSLFDAVITIATLTALLLQPLTGFNLDALAGLGVSVLILVSGVGLVKDAASALIGGPSDPALLSRITALVYAHGEVLGLHDLTLHDYGYQAAFGTAHIELPETMAFAQTHHIADAIEAEALKQLGVHLVIHTDPVRSGDDQLQRLRTQLDHALQIIDPALSAHDIQLEDAEGARRLVFDLKMPYGYTDAQAEQTLEALRRAMNNAAPGLSLDIRPERG